MAKVTAKFKKFILWTMLGILLVFSLFRGGVGQVYAVGAEGSELMQELETLTVNGKKFSAADYPVNAEGMPQLLNLCELGYGSTTAARTAYGLVLYVYNPAQLELKEDERNTVQMKIGSSERYSKYGVSLVSWTADMLFYKFKVDFTDEERSAALAALNADERTYDVSSIELYKQGFNSTDYPVSRAFTYTGYYGDELGQTVSYIEYDGVETIPIEVNHTSWRPEGTNGNSSWTQDTIHSVYFAVKKEYGEQFDYLLSVQARWKEATTAPILVTKDKDMYDAIEAHNLQNIEKANVQSDSSCLDNRTGLNYAFHTYPIGTLSDYCNEYFYGSDAAFYSLGNSYDPNIYFNKNGCKVLNQIPLVMSANYDNGVVTSTELTERIQLCNSLVDESVLPNKVAGKYQERFFSDYDEEFTTKTIKVGKVSDEDNLNEAVITSDKLVLYSEEVSQAWWQKVFGGASVSNQQNFKNIDAIKKLSDSDVKNKTTESLSADLYISSRDVPVFKYFYEHKSDDCDIYLMRFAVSEYWAQPTYDYKYSFTTGTNEVYEKISQSNSYLVKEKTYLDFDIIDFEYAKGAETVIIPVSMSPVDIFSELTPPPVFQYHDFKWYAIGTIAGLTVFYVVYRLVRKAVKEQ